MSVRSNGIRVLFPLRLDRVANPIATIHKSIFLEVLNQQKSNSSSKVSEFNGGAQMSFVSFASSGEFSSVDLKHNKLFKTSENKFIDAFLITFKSIFHVTYWDALHLVPNPALLPLCLFARLAGKRIISTIHEAPTQTQTRDFVTRSIFRTMYKMSTSRISVSKYVQNQMTSIWNMSSDVIHNGIDMSSTELFTEKKRDITKLSEILEISQTQWAEQFAAKRIVLYVGSLIDGKGVMDVIDVCEKRKDVLCIIVGRGYLKNKMANSLSKSQYILQRDFISPSNLAVLYASADVLFFPSVIDSFGLVYLEALASGLPVLSLKSAAAPEIITSAKLGILCANKGGLDGALTKILATKYNRSYLHKYVADNFSAKKMCGRYLAMYAGKEIK